MTLRGVARQVAWHEDGLLTFRVELIEDTGDIGGYVSVRAFARRTREVAADGDEVEVTGALSEDGILRLETLTNRTTGATFTPRFERFVGGLADGKAGSAFGWLAPFLLFPLVGLVIGGVYGLNAGPDPAFWVPFYAVGGALGGVFAAFALGALRGLYALARFGW